MWRFALPLLLAAQDAPTFVDVTEKAGLVQPLEGMMGHGGAWGDFDGDGKVDLFVGGFCDRPGSDVPTRLFRNRGDGTFQASGQVELHARTSGAVFADLDNNGTLELYVANNAKGKSDLQLTRSKLFRNDGAKLVDVSESSGACGLSTARNVGVFDYDGDGLLDLLLVEDRFTRRPNSVLLRNKGNLVFEDSKLLPEGVFGLGCASADLNDDGKPDFFIAHSNRLFVSGRNGYTEHSEAFAYKPADGEDWPCGAAFGDLDRDGDLDLVVTAHYKSARNFIFYNEGGLKFRREELGTVPIKCPHVEIQDFDNDGWPDLYLSVVDGTGRPLVLRNDRGRFALPELKELHYFPAGPTADFDGDGRIDIFLVNWFEGRRSTLLRNESPKKHWLQVKVVGRTVNRMGIGSKVVVNGLLQEVSIGYGYASGQPAICHFGLGEQASADVKVTLPNGKVIERKSVAADQCVVIEEEPTIDFVPFENLPQGGRGTLWSSWGDGLAASNGKYYTAIGDHRGTDATSHVYEYDPATKKLRLIVNVAEAIGQKPGDYGHGKIHAGIHEYEGALYFATYWGKPREIDAAYDKGYQGSILLRFDLKTEKVENLGAIVPKQGLPASHFDPDRALLYFHAVREGNVAVYDLKERKVKFLGGSGDTEGARTFMRDLKGRVYFTVQGDALSYYDPDANKIVETKAVLPQAAGARKGDSLRAAARCTKGGILYGMTAAGRLFAFDTAAQTVKDLGPNYGEGDYTAVMVMSPDEKFLYYAPGAHGSSVRSGTPVVRYEIATGKRDVIALLNASFKEKYTYTIGGTYNVQIDAAGEKLFFTFNGSDPGEKSPFGKPCVVVVHLK